MATPSYLEIAEYANSKDDVWIVGAGKLVLSSSIRCGVTAMPGPWIAFISRILQDQLYLSSTHIFWLPHPYPN